MKTALLILTLLIPGFARAENFKPLTGLPAFDALSEGSVGMTAFFNQLYVLAVGAAAIVAVVQIMLAGFNLAYSAGNHSTIEEARNKIQNAILGLLLVLSPTIIFGIINPDILNLDIDTRIFKENAVEDAAPVNPNVTLPPIELENTCALPAALSDLQGNLDAWRVKHPTGEWTASWTEGGYGQAGVGCCRLVKDKNGSFATPKTNTSYTPSGTLIFTYTCSSNGGLSSTPTSYIVSTMIIRLGTAGPYDFIIGKNGAAHAYPTLAECEQRATYTSDIILGDLKSGAYECAPLHNGDCPKWLGEAKSGKLTGPFSFDERKCVAK